MRIASFKISNYKSFLTSGEIHLTQGFNVIVGQNNVGKSGLIEALSLGFTNNPHRSSKTVQTINVPLQSHSNVELIFELSKTELFKTELLELISTNNSQSFFFPTTKTKESDVHLNHPLDEIPESFEISCTFQ